GRRQDRHGPGVGLGAQPLGLQPLQLLLRRLHRPAGRPPGPGHRGTHPGGAPGPERAGPACPPRHLDGPVPARRDRCSHDAGASAGARAGRGNDAGDRAVMAADTLPGVTVEGPQPSRAGPPVSETDPPAFTADDLRRLTGGRLLRTSRRPIRGAAVDSRLVRDGQLFVALAGERTDGHRYLAEAAVGGASALVVSRPIPPAVLDAL